MLREISSKVEADAAERQVETLQKELKAVEDVDRADFDALRLLGFSTEPDTAASTDGSAPVEEGTPVEESTVAQPT